MGSGTGMAAATVAQVTITAVTRDVPQRAAATKCTEKVATIVHDLEGEGHELIDMEFKGDIDSSTIAD